MDGLVWWCMQLIIIIHNSCIIQYTAVCALSTSHSKMKISMSRTQQKKTDKLLAQFYVRLECEHPCMNDK